MQAKEALYSAAITTFEDLAFAVADPDAGASPEWADEARVAFDGVWCGELIVRLDAVALAQLSANMLGAEDAPSAELQRDALAELANVICGHVLPSLAGVDVVFDLQAPVVGAVSERAAYRDAVRVTLALEGGHAEVILYGGGTQAVA